MLVVLQKVTTEVSLEEDRLRIVGVTEGNRRAVIWLTRRLLGFLLPVLWKHLDQQFTSAPPEHKDALQEFAQQAACDRLGHTEPVTAQADDESILPTSVDVGQTPDGIILTFRNAGELSYRLPLQGESLRQWIHILYKADQQANWQLPGWPDWLTAGKTAASSTAPIH